MTAEEIKARVAIDIQDLTEYKAEILSLLSEPSAETFEGVNATSRSLWVVGKHDEYMITFNELSGLYGLAFRNIVDDLIHLGDDGSIADVYATLIAREEESADGPKKTVGKKPGSEPFKNRCGRRPGFRKKKR